MALYQVTVTLNQVVTNEEINAAAKQLVANFVQPELDSLSRYALARALQSAAEACTKELAEPAIVQAKELFVSETAEGKDFVHNGNTFRVQNIKHYPNMSEYDPEYSKTERDLELCKQEQKVLNQELRAIQARILKEHPGLKAESTSNLSLRTK